MYQVIIVVHVLLGIGVIGLILMQQGKGADAGAAFGSGSSGSVFGAQGAASFLSRTTAILATLFFTTSLTLAVLSGKQSKTVDVMDRVDITEPKAVMDVPNANPTAAAPVVESVPAVAATPVAATEEKPVAAVDVKADKAAAIPDTKNKADEPQKSEPVAEKSDVKPEQKAADEKKVDKKPDDADKSDKHKDAVQKDSDKHTKKHKSDKKGK